MNNESQPVLTHERNLLTFWEEAKPNGLAEQKLGRVLFDKALMLRINTPGDKSEVIYEARREYPEECPHPIHGKVKKNPIPYERFGKYIDEYIAKGDGPQVVSGTPIDQWSLVDVRMAALLKHHGVYNVESLATLTDSQMQGVGMGTRALVEKAKNWLVAAAESSTAMEAQRQRQAVQDQLNALKEQFEGLAEAMAELPAEAQAQVRASVAKRGRPRKEAA